jgi:hypothetical protein
MYKRKRKIKNKKIQLNQRKKMNIYNIDELGYYSRQTFSCWKDLISILLKINLSNNHCFFQRNREICF